MQQQRNLTIVCQMMAQIRDLQNKVNSLSDAREFYDPRGNRPGQNRTFLSLKEEVFASAR